MNSALRSKHAQQMAFIERRTELINTLLEFDLFGCSTEDLRSVVDDATCHLRTLRAVERRRDMRAANIGGAS